VAGRRLVLIRRGPRTYVFLGDHGDHVVVAGVYCSCQSFTVNMMRGSPRCYHIYTVRLAEETGRYADIADRITEEDFEDILFEILDSGRSASLRRTLFSSEEA